VSGLRLVIKEGKMRTALILSLILIGIGTVFALDGQSANLEIQIDGHSVPKYYHNGSTYIEAIKGRSYSIRISNPIGERIAVALSVDGLNTIDAKHTDARDAAKWILDPYQSIVISGWQVNDSQARQFYFTNEENSYGSKLGKTQNLGVISAALFRERHPQVYRRVYPPPPPIYPPYPPYPRPLYGGAAGGMGGSGAMGGGSMDAQAEMRDQGSMSEEKSKSIIGVPGSVRPTQPDYAATGIGSKVSHEVERVYMDLQNSPFETATLRYEFRPTLERLGVFPPHPITPPRTPLDRRERSRGFSDGDYCPEP
jgi:hypothetical protein